MFDKTEATKRSYVSAGEASYTCPKLTFTNHEERLRIDTCGLEHASVFVAQVPIPVQGAFLSHGGAPRNNKQSRDNTLSQRGALHRPRAKKRGAMYTA